MDTDKTMYRALNTYIRKEWLQIYNLSFQLRKLEKEQTKHKGEGRK